MPPDSVHDGPEGSGPMRAIPQTGRKLRLRPRPFWAKLIVGSPRLEYHERMRRRMPRRPAARSRTRSREQPAPGPPAPPERPDRKRCGSGCWPGYRSWSLWHDRAAILRIAVAAAGGGRAGGAGERLGRGVAQLAVFQRHWRAQGHDTSGGSPRRPQRDTPVRPRRACGGRSPPTRPIPSPGSCCWRSYGSRTGPSTRPRWCGRPSTGCRTNFVATCCQADTGDPGGRARPIGPPPP